MLTIFSLANNSFSNIHSIEYKKMKQMVVCCDKLKIKMLSYEEKCNTEKPTFVSGICDMSF